MGTPVKISEFLRTGFFLSQDQLKISTLEGVFVIKLQFKRHNFGQQKSFRGPINIQGCAFCEFWWGTYGFGTISPQKPQILAKFHVRVHKHYKFQRHSPGGDTLHVLLLTSGTGSRSIVQ